MSFYFECITQQDGVKTCYVDHLPPVVELLDEFRAFLVQCGYDLEGIAIEARKVEDYPLDLGDA